MQTTDNVILSVKNLSCGIVQDGSFTVERGTCLSISGPSGSGKTTILSAIAGNRPCSGELLFNGISVSKLPSWKRPFRYLNQRLYLYNYLTVDGNLRLAQYAARQKRCKVTREKILNDFGILHLAKKYPKRISGGEQQRVALARALIGAPQLLLLDEPFSSLDWELRKKLWLILQDLKKQGLIMILVSHEPAEIEALADINIPIKNGRLIRSI